MVPNIVKDLGEKQVFLVPMLDALQYGQVPFNSGAKVQEMSKGLLNCWVGGVIWRWQRRRRRHWAVPTFFMGSECSCIPLPLLNGLYDRALWCK